MNYDIPSSYPKDSSDLDLTLSNVDNWGGQILRITREQNPTVEQKRFTGRVNDMLTRTMVRILISPQMAVQLPETASFNSSAVTLKKSVTRMAEIAKTSGSHPDREAYSELISSIGSIDMSDNFGRKPALIKLLEINAAFMAGPESHPVSVRPNIEDGAMELCAMFREVIETNTDMHEAMLHDSKIKEDLEYVATLSKSIDSGETSTE